MKSDATMLSPYLGLDLTDEKGFLCGKLLGDLGAEIIKIEKPGGDPARMIGPYYRDIHQPEKSLYWYAYNCNKKGITLDIERPEGQGILKQLIEKVDFLIESFPVGFMDKLGLSFSTLNQINPKLVFTSITPFGNSGPYKHFKSSDIVSMAMSGIIYVSGDPDRPPVRVSFPQAYQFAGAEAAVGTLLALYNRNLRGEGQHVDISMQWSGLLAQYDSAIWWATSKKICKRQGSARIRPNTGVKFQQFWPCKNGFVTFYYFGGQMGASSNRALVNWMESEGVECGILNSINWEAFDWNSVTQDEVKRMEEPTGQFFMGHTKEELYEGALQRGIMLYPVAKSSDFLENQQLAARKYWVEVNHPELDVDIIYPGAFVKSSQSACRIWKRAPLIGEHNREVYEEALGLSKREIQGLEEDGVI
jgi:crotonobetainyl-CoA:carnitine CoA-transferase CaiB-like acyl-CoA transferase